jgi:hypothetical protein
MIAALATVVGAIILGWQFVPSLTARLETRILIAQSPDLSSEYDRLVDQGLGLSHHVLQTPYWRSQTALYEPTAGSAFLFAIVVNYGPASADEILFSAIQSCPLPEVPPPVGTEISGVLGPLLPNHYYALLLDTLAPAQSQQSWNVANFVASTTSHQSILLHVTYRDGSLFRHSTHFALGACPDWPLPYPTSGAPYIKPDS